MTSNNSKHNFVSLAATCDFDINLIILSWIFRDRSHFSCVSFETCTILHRKLLFYFIFFAPIESAIFFSIKIPFSNFIMQFDFFKDRNLLKIWDFFSQFFVFLGGRYVLITKTKFIHLIFLLYLWSYP